MLWELEGRKRPIWGSGVMGPSQLSLWSHCDPGLEDTKPPSPALTNAEIESIGQPEGGGLSPQQTGTSLTWSLVVAGAMLWSEV